MWRVYISSYSELARGGNKGGVVVSGALESGARYVASSEAPGNGGETLTSGVSRPRGNYE